MSAQFFGVCDRTKRLLIQPSGFSRWVSKLKIRTEGVIKTPFNLLTEREREKKKGRERERERERGISRKR